MQPASNAIDPELSVPVLYKSHQVHFHPAGFIDLKSLMPVLGISRDQITQALFTFADMATKDPDTWHEHLLSGDTACLSSESFWWMPHLKFNHVGSLLAPEDSVDRTLFAQWYGWAISWVSDRTGVSQ